MCGHMGKYRTIRGFLGLRFRDITPIVENPIVQEAENQTVTWNDVGFVGLGAKGFTKSRFNGIHGVTRLVYCLGLQTQNARHTDSCHELVPCLGCPKYKKINIYVYVLRTSEGSTVLGSPT